MNIANEWPDRIGLGFRFANVWLVRLGGWYILPALGFTRFTFGTQIEMSWLCWRTTVSFPYGAKEGRP